MTSETTMGFICDLELSPLRVGTRPVHAFSARRFAPFPFLTVPDLHRAGLDARALEAKSGQLHGLREGAQPEARQRVVNVLLCVLYLGLRRTTREVKG